MEKKKLQSEFSTDILEDYNLAINKDDQCINFFRNNACELGGTITTRVKPSHLPFMLGTPALTRDYFQARQYTNYPVYL